MDDADRAQAVEELWHRNAMRAVLTKREAPSEEGGEHLCRDCGEPIPAERLAKVPGAVCCWSCQTSRECSRGTR